MNKAKVVEKTLISSAQFEDTKKWLIEIDRRSHQKGRKDFLDNQKDKKMSFDDKVVWAQDKINEFFEHCDKNKLTPEISFSGGKDSSVVLSLVRSIRPNIKAVVAEELFHPENIKLINKTKNIQKYPAKKSFIEVTKQYGFPVISKEVAQRINAVRHTKKLGNWIKLCLGLTKFRPIPKKYIHMVDTEFCKIEVTHACCSLIKGGVKETKTPKFVGTTIEESKLRKTNWLREGCNVYNRKHVICRPISLWTSEDVKRYLKQNKVPYSKAYEMGWNRTGCIACGFGMNIEAQLRKTGKIEKTRFELLKEYYEPTYTNFMYTVGVANALVESRVDIPIDDERYQKLYEKRSKEIDEWYSSKNLEKNINGIIHQIEKRTNGKFTEKEKKLIMERYAK